MSTKIDEQRLREYRRAGLSYKQIAKELGVTPEEARAAYESLSDGPQVTRYAVLGPGWEGEKYEETAEMRASPDGEWVRYDDIKHLLGGPS
jgi:hypothetical protein